MEYIIIEVGSTNTKVYNCRDSEILSSKLLTIEFKKNYKINNKILDSDIETLINTINSLKIKKESIYIYGTSIFRNLSENEKNKFLSEFKQKSGCDFNIVSDYEENKLTVQGVAFNIDYNGKLAVMIGGGGSTEIALVNNKKIVCMNNQNFGAMDIIEKYPDLANDKPNTPFDEVLKYSNSLLKDIDIKADILVLAGGDYLKFYENLDYKMEKNNIYNDINQPYMISKSKMDYYDLNFYYDVSLDNVRNADIENKNWWNGTRGMRICVKSIFDKIDAKYIIPTRISMVYGFIDKIMNNK
jgi:hypothetical protein